MMQYTRFIGIIQAISCVIAAPAFAQTAPAASNGLQKNQPIEISSDKLDVYQEDHKAIFTGNVIAVQGTSNLRAATMVVYYRDATSDKGAKKAAKAATSPVPDASAVAPAPSAAGTPSPQGIYRIDATTGVVFPPPTETAMGDVGVYNVDTDTIDLTGKNVTLTQGQNILKGTHVVHNMATGRSVLTSGDGTATDVTHMAGAKPARVHGLFMPQSDDKKAATPKPADKKAGGQ